MCAHKLWQLMRKKRKLAQQGSYFFTFGLKDLDSYRLC